MSNFITKLAWGLMLSLFMSVAAAEVVVQEPWIREAPPNAQATAGYMVLKNTADKAVTLTGARSDLFGHVMVHQTIQKDGMARMVHLSALEIPAKGEVIFDPNGYHLMLMMPTRALKAGDKAIITLLFADGSSQQVEFTVRAADGAAPAMQDHHHHH